MPPLGLHMTVARDLACELRVARIDADRGAYYLGATTPDIRMLTRWERERTHFFDLHDFGEQSGVHRLLESQPDLRDASAVNDATAAFVAGYISHLVMDERYICEIYRPVFGERSPLRGEVMANVMDRVLQYEIDRRDREDAAKVAEIEQALAETAVEVSVGFVSRELLLDWRQIAVDVINHPPDWGRFERIASRFLRQVGIESDEQRAKFMEDVPALLDRTIACVGFERIEQYLMDARTRARQAIREYLS